MCNQIFSLMAYRMTMRKKVKGTILCPCVYKSSQSLLLSLKRLANRVVLFNTAEPIKLVCKMIYLLYRVYRVHWNPCRFWISRLFFPFGVNRSYTKYGSCWVAHIFWFSICWLLPRALLRSGYCIDCQIKRGKFKHCKYFNGPSKIFSWTLVYLEVPR
jgi:hypothetical protein